MVSSLAPLALAYSLATIGGLFDHENGRVVARVPLGHRASHAHHTHGGRITPPGPGLGWGFPNGNPDGYGWVDYGTTLPLGADRTPDYFFRRQYATPIPQMFFPTYYNPYVSRGQRYLPYSGCGGAHPAGGPPLGSSEMSARPYEDWLSQSRPVVQPPDYTGEVDAPAEPAGGSGLIP